MKFKTQLTYPVLLMAAFFINSLPAYSSETHPILKSSEYIVYSEIEAIPSTATPTETKLIVKLIKSYNKINGTRDLKIDYPLDKSVFPNEIVPPRILWHDTVNETDTWLIDLQFKDNSRHVYVLVPGNRPPPGKKDPACEVDHIKYTPPAYQLNARSWLPENDLWEGIKKASINQSAGIRISGFNSSKSGRILTTNTVQFETSSDPVDGCIFYRDVPLVPGITKKGVIKPLAEGALPLITWRLRDISKPESRVLLKKMPTCANCHSFTPDGKYLAMDLDGPSGDKGTYLISEIKPHMEIKKSDIITWNSLKERPKDHNTLGFMAQISPSGKYAVCTLNEALYVRNFTNFQFLQVFYPTRGVLGYYSKKTDEVNLLPGADDTDYVHCDPVWSPDGKYIVFARSKARDPYNRDQKKASYANDPLETQIRFDLYRMDFNEGRGGIPVPIKGASDNGMSNSFPKISPDGQWIVFVKSRNGQLMRPDSKLWIVPSGGGKAREMTCNTSRMNSWHSFSPNGRWMVFSSKAGSPYTQMYITHIDEKGNDSPPILVPNSTAANRAVNIPEFVNVPYENLKKIDVPVVRYHILREQADKLFNKGELEESIKLYMESLKINPEFNAAYYNIGAAYYNQKKFRKAREYFEKSIEIDPGKSEGYHLLAKTLARLGELENSIRNFVKAMELDLENPEICYDMGNTFILMKDFEKAQRAYERAVKYGSDNAKYLFAMGRLHFGLRKLDEALDSYLRGIQLSPKDKDAIWKIGDIYFIKKEYEKAKDYYMKYLELDKSNMAIYLNIGNIFKKSEELNDAIQYFEKARMVDPNHPQPYFHLGNSYQLLMKFDKAVEFFNQGLKISPDDPVAHIFCGHAYFSLQEYENAISHYQRALDLKPDMVRVHFDWGNALFKMKKFEKAIQHYQKVLDVYPDDKDTLNNLEFARDALKRRKNGQL